MAEACCDIQCFHSNNAYLIKELALTSLDGSVMEHYIFRAPFPFHDLDLKDQQTNAYLSRHKHCLNWYTGVVNYSQLPLILEESVANMRSCTLKVNKNKIVSNIMYLGRAWLSTLNLVIVRLCLTCLFTRRPGAI